MTSAPSFSVDPVFDITNSDYWKNRCLSAETRLATEIQRCGRAEGALDVVSQQYATAQLRVATLTAEVAALRGEVGDLRDELEANRDESTDADELTPREVYTVGR